MAGLRNAVQGFNSAQTFAQFQLMKKLGPALTEIFASDESDFGRLFSNYLTQPPACRRQAAQPCRPPAARPPKVAADNRPAASNTRPSIN